VLAQGRPTRAEDVADRPAAASSRLGIGARTALVVPLTFRGQTLGVLSVYDRVVDGPEFGLEDEDLLLSFAASAATAVHTARSVTEGRLAHALDAAEHERTRWARELHDETLQGLGALQLMLASALNEASPEKRDEKVRRAADQVRAEIKRLRNLIVELRPAELDELGLEAALEALAHRRAADSLELSIDADLGGTRLPPSVESTIYRLVQEALTNAEKHASATHVNVRISARDGSVELRVADDGCGFDAGAVAAGFGLVGMRERAALLRGVFEIQSAPGHGTVVRAELPTT
jgi:signal transduction histidine kinase